MCIYVWAGMIANCLQAACFGPPHSYPPMMPKYIGSFPRKMPKSVFRRSSSMIFTIW